jgi:hypothetical protein
MSGSISLRPRVATRQQAHQFQQRMMRPRLWHQRLEWNGGSHSFLIQYGTGAASNFSTSIEDPPCHPIAYSGSSSQSKCFINRMIGLPSYQFSSTSGAKITIGTSGCHSALDPKSFSTNTYLSHLRKDSTTRTVLVSTTAGFVRSR